MRFTESKKRTPWVLLFLLICAVVGILALGFCGMTPTQKATQKTILGHFFFSRTLQDNFDMHLDFKK